MAGPLDLVARLPQLLPLAVAWAEDQEARILVQGVPLAPADVALARLVGVTRPADVRVLLVPEIAPPDDPALRRACDQLGFLGPSAIGLTIFRGMFLRSGHERDRVLMAHELRHVAQYEQHGSVATYLAVYFRELLQHGYDRAPFELDACAAAARAVREAGGR